jgi:hypothetical protein
MTWLSACLALPPGTIAGRPVSGKHRQVGYDDGDPFADRNTFFDDDPILAEQVERWDLQKDDRSTGRPRPQRRRGLFARLLRRRR